MSNLQSAIYNPAEAGRIQHAYRSIFPTITPTLADYWGLPRQRAWSYLTTDFHSTSYDALLSLHRKVEDIDQQAGLNMQDKGALLRAASSECSVGFSIGICPWTDHLLGESYSDAQESATILLGHDWYPIVVPDLPLSESPIRTGAALRHAQAYWPAAPEAVFSNETVGLFFNLYPDFRPPGEAKCGNLRGYGYSYAECLVGLDAMVAAICSRFESVKIISWGSNVWDALLVRVPDIAPRTLLSTQIQANPGRILTINLGGRRLPYLPTMHPGHWGNFGRPYHLLHVKAGFGALELGLPGPVDAGTEKVRIARFINTSTIEQ